MQPIALGLALSLLTLHAPATKASHAPHPTRLALMCFKSGEQTSGMNKICYYDCGGSQAAITVGVASLCPLSIDR